MKTLILILFLIFALPSICLAQWEGTGIKNLNDVDQSVSWTDDDVLVYDDATELWTPETLADTTLTEEQVEDFVGGMLGGTETGISVTYQDATNDIDFVVATEGTAVLSTGEGGGSKYLREDGDGTCSWQTPAGGGTMSSFFVEDGDGTEVEITDSKEWKFVEGTGIDINWTDTDNGTDADPYDLTITADMTLSEVLTAGASTSVEPTFTGGVVFGADDDPSNIVIHSGSTIRIYEDSDDYYATLQVQDGTTQLYCTGQFGVSAKTTLDASMDVKNGAASSGIISIYEDSDDGSNYASFQVPALTANTVYTLPPDDGDAGEQLQTNGSGTLTWEAAGTTALDDIGNPDADDTIALAGYEVGFSSTLDEAAHTVLKIDHTDGDVTNATTILKIQSADDAGTNLTFIDIIDDSGGTPNSVWSVGADGNTLIDGTLGVTGTITGDVTGALTGNADTATTASAGDAAVDFFGAGVDAVTDATTCTDIEGTGLSITTSVLNWKDPNEHSKSFVITSPDADADAAVWRSDVAITIVGVHGVQVGGTNIVGHLAECDANGLNCVACDDLDMTITTSNVNDDGTLSNPSIDAGDYVGWITTSVSGTITRCTITFEYTIN